MKVIVTEYTPLILNSSNHFNHYLTIRNSQWEIHHLTTYFTNNVGVEQ